MTDQRASSISGASVDGIPERFVPNEMRGQLVEAEHIARYSWAARVLLGPARPRCGLRIGYGSDLLLRGRRRGGRGNRRVTRRPRTGAIVRFAVTFDGTSGTWLLCPTATARSMSRSASR